jgi:hypothetical protein
VGNVSRYANALRKHYQAFFLGGFLATGATWLQNLGLVRLEGWRQVVYVAVFLFGGVLFAGFRAWEDLHEELTRLRETPAPRLSIEFDPTDPFCLYNDGGNYRLGVKVVNNGTRGADRARVRLTDVSPPVGPDPLNGHFPVMRTDTTTEYSVSPGLPVYLDVLFQERTAIGARVFLRAHVPGIQRVSQFVQPTEIVLTMRLEWDQPSEPFVLTLRPRPDGFFTSEKVSA